MDKIVRQLEQYLNEVLGLSVAARPWDKAGGLPQYLRQQYRFFRAVVLGTECILMVDVGEEEQTPAVIAKHLDQVRARNDLTVVYVRHAVTSYNRKRLIERKVPFVVPVNQMYLPMFGVDLREHLKRLREKKPSFGPSTQVLILHALWSKDTENVTPAETAKRLGYSPMTMTRAFDELEAAGIGEHSVMGKERRLCFVEKGALLWEKVSPYLKTPVRRRFYVASSPKIGNGCLAGQSALAFYTSLAEPETPVFAFSMEEWKKLTRKKNNVELKLPEPGSAEIELWKYSPARFADDGKVDRLSLYLSLKDHADERVQSALDALLGDMQW